MSTRVLRAAAAFWSIDSVTVPGPLPVRPPVIPTQTDSLDAVQEQPLIASTLKVTGPPVAGTFALERSSVKRHGAPSWATSTCAEDTVMVAFRALGVVFGATRYGRVASPWPLVGPLMLTHAAGVSADHVQSRSAATVT
jgi:hypothetical protein